MACIKWLVIVLVSLGAGRAVAQPEDRDPELEKIRQELRELRDRVSRFESLEPRSETGLAAADPYGSLLAKVGNRFTLGGYGDVHANFGEGGSADQFDLHRLVAFIGYEFADWIRLSSEIELEHGFVSDESDGELSVEQFYFDFYCSDLVNVRFGRVLIPLGIINQNHEPTTFNGVERPSFSKVIIPTTFFSDGLGIFGDFADWVSYELYLVGGLDGTGFNAINGIRGGRIKERPSLHEPAITARLDFYPLIHSDRVPEQDLRVGVSIYSGGLDNGNKGNNTNLNADIAIYSADFEFTQSWFDLRGVAALERIRNAEKIGNGTASAIVGGYLEAAAHVFPEGWRTGRFSQSDLVVFLRHDWIDTQNKLPSGVVRNDAGRRTEWTTGLTFFFTPTLVGKMDIQFRNDKTSRDLDTLFNLGVGWVF